MSDPTEFLKVVDYSATSIRTMNNSAGQKGIAPHNLILASEDFSDSNWTKTDTTVTSNAAAAPDGTITADKWTNGSTNTSVIQNITVVSGTEYVFAAFAKYIDNQWIKLSFDGSLAWFDIQNGVVGTDNLGTCSITALADGWYMLAGTKTTSDTGFTAGIVLADADNSVTETSGTSAYIWGAHLYENGLAGMFDVPENERALASLTKYLPNKAVVTGPNLVSNGTFDSNINDWTDASTGTGSVAQNAGAMDLTGVDVSNRGIARQTLTVEDGAAYRVTFDASGVASQVDVTNSDFPADTITTGAYVYHFTASSTSCQIEFNNYSNGTQSVDNITVTKVDRDPTAARFLPRRGNHEYIDGAWVKGLKVESEARTNLVTEAFDFTTDWLNNNTSSLAQDATGVDGETSAVTLLDSGATGTGAVQVYDTITVATTTAYTFSVYAKADQLDWVALRGEGFTTPANGGVYFDLTNGVLGTESAGFTGSIEDIGSGWFRCAITFTTGVSDTSGNVVIKLADADGDAVVDLDGTSSVIIWGAQFEAGSTPSSLIPTYGATRTRTAETFTQKSDKIIWPNTTYVDGTELVTNGTFDTDTTGWTEQDVNATFTVTNGQLTIARGATGSGYVSQTITTVSGSVYKATVDLIDDGPLDFRVGTTIAAGDIASTGTVTTSGSYELIFVASGTTTHISGVNPTNSTSVTIDNISVKEINPRALCVVMHGYMTYADEGNSQELQFWRSYDSATNNIRVYLQCTGADTGQLVADCQANGTYDFVAGATDEYSPGINVPFKIASRHLDNAVQGAADGTATTENTTPPGLADLSTTQAEWFYDGGGFHIEDVLMYVEDIEEGGLTALTAKGFPQ